VSIHSTLSLSLSLVKLASYVYLCNQDVLNHMPVLIGVLRPILWCSLSYTSLCVIFLIYFDVWPLPSQYD
jgi:hypothetical protein